MIERDYLLNRLEKQACYHKQACFKKLALIKKLINSPIEKNAFDLSALQPVAAEAGNIAGEIFNPINMLALLGFAAAPVGAKDIVGNRNAAMGYRMFAEATPEMVVPYAAAQIAAPILGKKVLPEQKVPANYKKPDSMLKVWLDTAIPYYKAKFHIGVGNKAGNTVNNTVNKAVTSSVPKQTSQVTGAVQNAVQNATKNTAGKIDPYKMIGAAGAGLAVPLAVGGIYKYMRDRNDKSMEKQAILGGPNSNNPLRAAVRRAAELKRQVGRRVWDRWLGGKWDTPGVPLQEQAAHFGSENATRKNLRSRLQTAGESSIGLGQLSKNPEHQKYVPPDYTFSDGKTIGINGDDRYFKRNWERGGVTFNPVFGHYEEPGFWGKLFGKKTKWVQDFNPGQEEIDNYFNVRNMLKEYKNDRASFNKKVYGTENPSQSPVQTQQEGYAPWYLQAASVPAAGLAGYGVYSLLSPSKSKEEEKRDKKLEAIRNIAKL